jgi:hypothetical protein
MKKPCNNKSNCHDNRMITHEQDGVRYICTICWQQNVLRIGEDGRMNNREYTKVFKRDLLQPSDNLYFKVHPDKMSLI